MVDKSHLPLPVSRMWESWKCICEANAEVAKKNAGWIETTLSASFPEILSLYRGQFVKQWFTRNYTWHIHHKRQPQVYQLVQLCLNMSQHHACWRQASNSQHRHGTDVCHLVLQWPWMVVGWYASATLPLPELDCASRRSMWQHVCLQLSNLCVKYMWS